MLHKKQRHVVKQFCKKRHNSNLTVTKPNKVQNKSHYKRDIKRKSGNFPVEKKIMQLAKTQWMDTKK
jgi:hypothetical protein